MAGFINNWLLEHSMRQIAEKYMDSTVSPTLQFDILRKNTVGSSEQIQTPFGLKPLVYADWIASGRLYAPIEERLHKSFGPFVGNTHTETSATGTAMTIAYHEAKQIIKRHVNALPTDSLIAYGSGMTGVVNKFQRMLGIRVPEKLNGRVKLAPEERPVVFVTHMEHHSNHTSWIETIADVECIRPDNNGLVDIDHLEELLLQHKDRTFKMASVTACSNVTGIFAPYYQIAELMHKNNGFCFVDFACSAPYVEIDMNPENPLQRLDAIFFSPHKFLGGPGSAGIMVFNSELYNNSIPDNPGGGTVKWTNPWKGHQYIESIEDREDGGTPPFLQTIKAAMCIKLKEKIGVKNILDREHVLLNRVFERLEKIKSLHILSPDNKERLGVVSFYIDGLHYNLGVKLLNDHFGIQVRGGCSCAGTYGHYLLNVSKEYSREITDQIDKGDLSAKPGWIRLSLHPTMDDDTIEYILDAVDSLARNWKEWQEDYEYQPENNEFRHKTFIPEDIAVIQSWFEL